MDKQRPQRVWGILLNCMVFVLPAFASGQIAIGLGVANGLNHTWKARSTWSACGLVEGRTTDSAMFVWRGSVAYHWPRTWSTDEHYSRNTEPFGEVTISEHGSLSKLDVAVDMKWPYGCMYCPGGRYRGGYVMLGAGWTRSWYGSERRMIDTGSAIDVHDFTELVTDQFSIRLTEGAEINYSWGGLFAELMLTGANRVNSTDQGLIFVNTLMVTIGYRFSFAKLPMDGSEDP